MFRKKKKKAADADLDANRRGPGNEDLLKALFQLLTPPDGAPRPSLAGSELAGDTPPLGSDAAPSPAPRPADDVNNNPLAPREKSRPRRAAAASGLGMRSVSVPASFREFDAPVASDKATLGEERVFHLSYDAEIRRLAIEGRLDPDLAPVEFLRAVELHTFGRGGA